LGAGSLLVSISVLFVAFLIFAGLGFLLVLFLLGLLEGVSIVGNSASNNLVDVRDSGGGGGLGSLVLEVVAEGLLERLDSALNIT